MPFHICFRISLGISLLLRLLERVFKRNAGFFHACKDIVGRAVQNTEHSRDIFLGEAGVDRTKQRDAAADAGFKEIAAVIGFRDLQEFGTMSGHKLFVGCTDADPALQSLF